MKLSTCLTDMSVSCILGTQKVERNEKEPERYCHMISMFVLGLEGEKIVVLDSIKIFSSNSPSPHLSKAQLS